MVRYRVIVPTYQAEKHMSALLPALEAQGLDPERVLVIDSSSKDGTVARFREFGAQVLVIPQSEFNHGGTRRMAVERYPDAEFFVLLTQDAIPIPGALDRLLAVFDRPEVGIAYGRQRPRPQARGIERHARLFNYPADASQLRGFEDRAKYGVKTTFCSNSFSAYRTTALAAVGNFPQESFFGEDQIVAGRMLMAGWQVAYVSEAEAVHSHCYRVSDDFKRYFDIGVFHSRNRWLLESFGKAEGEGLKFVKSELKYLMQHEPTAILSACFRTLLKYAGYRLGMIEQHIPSKVKEFSSMAPYYWRL
ncbi:MAG: glycosyl transferase family 2 [Hydrocarboniphaga sp.]|uniref:glycosyltransferase family 2 protein n=1 Tax=Hydrocarboniphaga sp. TaxID=2033016 RepID=UPI00263792DC|nr:glycosyltransferase [Hydrocarboniphaga sp.]MDB5970496.1 glycosyl transferase family 2 [Hydrocarboniphaga sp.]